jgi:hypothetical protein
MSPTALHGFLILISALALQLVFTIVLGALFTSGFYLHRAWVWQRSRIDHLNAQAIGYQRRFDFSYMRFDSNEYWIDYLHMTRALYTRMFPIYMHRWLPADMEERPAFHRRPGFRRDPLDIANLDGQDEREWQPDSDDEQDLGTRVIRNVAAQRSRDIAEMVDPRSYGISPGSSTSSDDNEDTSQCLPTTQSDRYEDGLSGPTLCDEAEQPQAYLREGYDQGRGPRHFGHWDHNDDDDPYPHLPHPHWSEGNQIAVTATTTTQSAHIATLTGQVPSSSVTVTTAVQPVTLNPGTDLPSLAAVQNVELSSRTTNGLVSHDDNRFPANSRITIPIPCFRQAQIHQMSHDLEDVHIRCSACGAQRRAGPQEQGSSPPAQPSLWTPPPLGTRSDGNGENSSTRVRSWQPKQVTEEEAARLHGTPRQWPEPTYYAGVNDEATDPDETHESIPEQERAHAQHQANEFARQHPHLVRRPRGQGPNIRGGGGGSVRPDWGEGEILVEEAQLLARIQHRQSEMQTLTQELQHMQREVDRLRKHRMRKQPDEQVKKVWEHHRIDTHSLRYQRPLAADAARKHHHMQRERGYGPQHTPLHPKREAKLQHYSCGSDGSNRHHNYAPLEADARSIQSPQCEERLYTELGYQHHLELDDDNDKGSFQYGVHHSCPYTYNRQQQGDVYAEHQHQLAEFEQQHRFRAPVQTFLQSHNLHQIYHIPPPLEGAQTEHAPTNLSSHHHHLDRELGNGALEAIREAQSLMECETARTYLGVLQIALDRRRAELEADARATQSARSPMVYTNTGDCLVLTPRGLTSHVVAERGLMHNAANPTRVNANFEPVDRDEYRWYAQYPSNYDGEKQSFGSYYGEGDADERGIMDHLTSYGSGSVPPFLRGGTSDLEIEEEVFLSPDYDHVAVSRVFAKLNKELARAQKRIVGGHADQDLEAELQYKIDWLRRQRDFAEGSDENISTVCGERFRAGAGLREVLEKMKTMMTNSERDIPNAALALKTQRHLTSPHSRRRS